jgi:hypothetical protein
MPTDDDRVFDLATAAAALREECVFTRAMVSYARRAIRGQRISRRLRRVLADVERAAERAQAHARLLDEMIAIAQAPPAGRA